eukprot:GHVR01105334.1.p2 GENE.GHVR01105334.1~~GHVR01105334.1.p2  ORF type:complete len:139 (+),score=23.15 GHVR01105334.1:250-666(+)
MMAVSLCLEALDVMRILPYGSFFLSTVPADGNIIAMKSRRLTVEMIAGAAIQTYLRQLPIDSGYSVVQRAMASEAIARMSRLVKQEAIKAVGSRVSPTVDEIGLIPMVKTTRYYILPNKRPPYISTLTMEQGAIVNIE